MQTEIEIPRHCPLCHKFVGNNVYHVVMADGSVACIHCWHLAQEEMIRALDELSDWIVHLEQAWRWVRSRLSWSYWLVDRKRWRKIAAHQSDTQELTSVA